MNAVFLAVYTNFYNVYKVPKCLKSSKASGEERGVVNHPFFSVSLHLTLVASKRFHFEGGIETNVTESSLTPRKEISVNSRIKHVHIIYTSLQICQSKDEEKWITNKPKGHKLGNRPCSVLQVSRKLWRIQLLYGVQGASLVISRNDNFFFEWNGKEKARTVVRLQ